MKKAVLGLLACAVMLCGAAQGAEQTSYTITLTENQTTGYAWETVVSDETVLAVADGGYVTDESEEALAGAGGTHTWAVSAVGKGEAKVTFIYTRSWESSPDDTVIVYSFAVDAQGCLTLLAVEGASEETMPGNAIISLPENPTTGYQWEVQMEPEGVLTPDCDTYTADEAAEGMVGTGGTHTWIFSGTAEGVVALTFSCARSFAEDEAPANTVKFYYAVDTAGKVTRLRMEGSY